MATIVDAQNALIAHLQVMPGRPAIAYPNGPLVTELPRIVVQISSAQQRTFDMSGQTEGVAEIIARIEAKDGEFDSEAMGILSALQVHFRPGVRLSDVTTILEAPQARPAYEAGGVYHVPVIIRGRTDF